MALSISSFSLSLSLARFFYANSFRYGFVNVTTNRRDKDYIPARVGCGVMDVRGQVFEISFFGKIEKLELFGRGDCNFGGMIEMAGRMNEGTWNSLG